MKTYFYLLLVMGTLGYTTRTDISQDNEIIKVAVFEGYDGDGYNFFHDDDIEGDYIFFKTVSKEILNKYNLNSDEFINKEFSLTYNVKKIDNEEDEVLELKNIIIMEE